MVGFNQLRASFVSDGTDGNSIIHVNRFQSAPRFIWVEIFLSPFHYPIWTFQGATAISASPDSENGIAFATHDLPHVAQANRLVHATLADGIDAYVAVLLDQLL